MTKLLRAFFDALLFLRQLLYGLVRNNTSKLAARVRRWSLRTPCNIDTNVLITHPHNFIAAQGSGLRHGCHIGNSHGLVRLGHRSHLGSYCHINAVYGDVRIGDDVAIGPGTKIFSYSNRYVEGQPIYESKLTADVDIGHHVFIGANVIVLPGCTIGSNVVVGAGSVVNESLPACGLYVGSPARLVRTLDEQPSTSVPERTVD